MLNGFDRYSSSRVAKKVDRSCQRTTRFEPHGKQSSWSGRANPKPVWTWESRKGAQVRVMRCEHSSQKKKAATESAAARLVSAVAVSLSLLRSSKFPTGHRTTTAFPFRPLVPAAANDRPERRRRRCTRRFRGPRAGCSAAAEPPPERTCKSRFPFAFRSLSFSFFFSRDDSRVLAWVWTRILGDLICSVLRAFDDRKILPNSGRVMR